MKISQLPVQIDSETETRMHLIAQEADGTPVGMAVVGLDKNEQAAWISQVFVHPAHRREGIGQALMQAAIQACRTARKPFASLTVKDTNAAAQRLYKSLGFKSFMKGTEGYTQYIKTL